MRPTASEIFCCSSYVTCLGFVGLFDVGAGRLVFCAAENTLLDLGSEPLDLSFRRGVLARLTCSSSFCVEASVICEHRVHV